VVIVLCVLASSAGFFFSLNHGEIWPLAWVAPIPVLWLAFGPLNRWIASAAAWAAYALGATNVLFAYAGEMPWYILVLAVAGPALYFAATAAGARFVAFRLGSLAGVLAFAVLWTSCDYLAGLGRDGTAPSPAYSQVGAPFLVQGASVFGLWIVTFVLGLVPAGIAMGLRKREFTPVILVVIAFAVNAGFGEWRLLHADNATAATIGLAADDSIALSATARNPQLAVQAAVRYARATRTLSAAGASLVVFPEKIARFADGTRNRVESVMRVAALDAHTTIVIGFDDRAAEPRNEALIFTPDGAMPSVYDKRHFVSGLEDIFVPGDAPLSLGDRTNVAICKDMDYPGMLRGDSTRLHPTLLLVPAWDFDRDRWWHARLAIMRGVEDGFSLARAAKDGLLTLSDAEGRVVAMKRSEPSGMVTLVGNLRRGPGDTLFLHIGDVLAWLCIAASLLLVVLAFLKRPQKPSSSSP
jgi:apolipoprotein N-acyltransferase